MAGQGGTLCLTAEDIEGLAKALGDAGCRFDRRGDVVRASFHLWNSIEDAELVGSILRDFPARQIGAAPADQRKPLGRAA